MPAEIVTMTSDHRGEFNKPTILAFQFALEKAKQKYTPKARVTWFQSSAGVAGSAFRASDREVISEGTVRVTITAIVERG